MSPWKQFKWQKLTMRCILCIVFWYVRPTKRTWFCAKNINVIQFRPMFILYFVCPVLISAKLIIILKKPDVLRISSLSIIFSRWYTFGYSQLMHFPWAVMLTLGFLVLALIFVKQRGTSWIKAHQLVSILLKFRSVNSDSFFGKID